MLAKLPAIGQDERVDFTQTGLLDGLGGEERRARVCLLERLHNQGFTLEQLTRAVSEDRLALLPLERALGGSLTAAEIAAATGTPAEVTLRMRRLLGLPRAGADEPVFGEADLEAARAVGRFLEVGLDETALAEVTRVLGEAMARLAATTAGAFAESFLRPGDSEAEVADRFAALVGELRPAVAPALTAAFVAHLREAVSRGMIGRAELASGKLAGARQLAVCFADLVGFTRLGGELEAGELSGMASALAELAREVAEPPVRLVKTIGDAAMLVCPEARGLIGAALALVEGAEAAELPSLRAGVALGPALERAGDVFGHTVNLASRVTGVARPGSVLCTQEARDAAPQEFEWSFAGRFRLKGLANPAPLHRARPRRG
jgi:adenylate cyclase